MTTYIRTTLAGVLLACAVLATAVGVTRCDDGDDAPVPAQAPYVALGDSYTAGPGIPGQTGNPPGCDRNYPALIAAELGLKGADFKDVSASGAKISGPFEGHDACADADTRWIEPLLPDSPAAAVHSNERGERALADAVLHTLREVRAASR